MRMLKSKYWGKKLFHINTITRDIVLLYSTATTLALYTNMIL